MNIIANLFEFSRFHWHYWHWFHMIWQDFHCLHWNGQYFHWLHWNWMDSEWIYFSSCVALQHGMSSIGVHSFAFHSVKLLFVYGAKMESPIRVIKCMKDIKLEQYVWKQSKHCFFLFWPFHENSLSATGLISFLAISRKITAPFPLPFRILIELKYRVSFSLNSFLLSNFSSANSSSLLSTGSILSNSDKSSSSESNDLARLKIWKLIHWNRVRWNKIYVIPEWGNQYSPVPII